MSALGMIPYGHIKAIYSTCGGGSCQTAQLVDQLNMRVFIDLLITPGNSFSVLPGSYVTVDTGNPAVNGIYKVRVKTRNGAYDTVELATDTMNRIEKKVFRLIDQTDVSGQVYFGKVNGPEEEGGQITRVLNTDFGQVMKAAVMGIVAIMLIRYLIKD